MHFERARCPVLHQGTPVLASGSARRVNSASHCPIDPDTTPAHAAPVPSSASDAPEPDAAPASASTPSNPGKSGASPQPASFPEPTDHHMSHNDQSSIDRPTMPEHLACPSEVVQGLTRRYPYLSEQLCATAIDADWQLLAKMIKNTDYHHCVLCGQWLAHPGYFSRHVKAQHAEAFVLHSEVLKWLEGRTTSILSPCQFCATDFKVRKCSRPRHARECPVLYRAGLLLRLCASYTVPAAACTFLTVPENDSTAGHGVTHEGCPPSGNPGRGQPRNPGCSGPGEPPLGHDAQVRGSPRQASPERSRSGQHRAEHTIGTSAGGGGCNDSGARTGAHGGPERQEGGGQCNPGGQGQWRSGEMAEALRKRQCQDIRRWLAAGSQPGLQPPSRGTGPCLGEQGLAGSSGALGSPLEERLGQTPGPGQRQGHLESLHEHGQAASSPRGSVWHQPLSRQLRDVCPVPGHVVDGPGALCRSRGLENHEEGNPGPSYIASQGLAAEALGGPDAQKGRDDHDQRGDRSAGQGHADPRRAVQHSIFGMEQDHPGFASETGPRPDDPHPGPRAPENYAAPGDSTDDGHEVPRNSGALPGNEVGGGAVTFTDRLKDSRRAPTLELHATPVPQCSLPSDGGLPARRQNGQIGLGCGSAEAGRRLVRSLSLANPCNYCYGNSAVLSLCWLLCIGPPDEQPLLEPALMLILKWLCAQTGTVALWRNVRWLTLHTAWREPSRQHDVVEYFAFLRPWLSPRIRHGSWEARQMSSEGTHSVDEGHTWPLMLSASLSELATQRTEPVSMQALIDLWSAAQVGLQALTSEPPALLIQICRFRLGPPNPGSKVFLEVEPEPYIMVPAFQHPLNHHEPLALQYRRYCRVATILHEGEELLAGHYRTVLYDPSLGSLITNDAVPAHRMPSRLQAHVQRNSYAFIYKYCPEMPAQL